MELTNNDVEESAGGHWKQDWPDWDSLNNYLKFKADT